jgi:hypothetical protein
MQESIFFAVVFPIQEPYRWSSVEKISRTVLSIRYSLLPYYYTLMYKAQHNFSESSYVLSPSAMVVKPLFFEFHKDITSYAIDQQFLVGPAVLISPQLQLGKVWGCLWSRYIVGAYKGWGLGLWRGCRAVSGARVAPKPSVLGGGGGANRTLLVESCGRLFVVIVVADIVDVAGSEG